MSSRLRGHRLIDEVQKQQIPSWYFACTLQMTRLAFHITNPLCQIPEQLENRALPISSQGERYFLPRNLATASGVTGVNRFTRLPSGSWKSTERFPQGIVVGS